MDRLLTRAHGLFGAGAGSGGGEVFAAGGGGGSVPPPPAGGSGLGSGVAAAGGVYEQSQAGVSGLDVDSRQTAGAGGAVAGQGRAGAGVIRDQARTVAAATAPLGNSAAGARLVVAAMDEHLAAMQRQLDTTTEQNKVLAARLRQLAEAYRGAGGAGMGAGMPMAGMGRLPMGGGAGGGGLSGLSGLAALPASLMSGRAGGRAAQWSAAEPGLGGSTPGGSAGSPLGGLTPDSSPREVAAAIIHEAHRRGYSPRQTIAILADAMQESGLRARAVSPNGLWKGIFQQDTSYPGRSNPNTAISEFFDRLGHHGGPSSPDIWKSIFWLQQRPGEPSAAAAVAHGRQAYLTEIQSRLPKATALYRDIAGLW